MWIKIQLKSFSFERFKIIPLCKKKNLSIIKYFWNTIFSRNDYNKCKLEESILLPMVKVRVPRLIVKYENFPSLFPFLFITEEFFSSKEEIFLFLQTVTNSYPPFRSLLNYSFENGIHEHSSFDHHNKRIVFSNEKEDILYRC